MKTKVFFELLRPFTLFPPLLGMLSGSACAWGSAHNLHPKFSFSLFFALLLGSFCASLLNGASNIINQVYDLNIDKVNKPNRPIPRGAVSVHHAKVLSIILYIISIIPVWWITPPPYDENIILRTFAPIQYHSTFFVFIAGMLLTFIYSAPFLGRTKKNGLLANFTIALARGELLKVAGWSMIANIFILEPWYIGFIFFLFLLGATSTKDFSDIEGDRKFGCLTLPVRYGAVKSAKIISPFFVIPWLFIPLGVFIKANGKESILTGNPYLLLTLSVILTIWGIYTVKLILKDPNSLTETENHPSWKHMYLMMMFAQIGFGLSYIL
ncbi:MAG: UbiA family prenyltransferase [Acidobacteria bacterium]|nr:UbiA family prenyltransferase [Acidobacteriota bacterium]